MNPPQSSTSTSPSSCPWSSISKRLISLHSMRKNRAKKWKNSGFFSVGKLREKKHREHFLLSPAFGRIFNHRDNPDPNCSWHLSRCKLGTGRSWRGGAFPSSWITNLGPQGIPSASKFGELSPKSWHNAGQSHQEEGAGISWKRQKRIFPEGEEEKKRKRNWIKGGFGCEFFWFSVGFLVPKWEVLKENLASEWQSQNVSMRKWEDGKIHNKGFLFQGCFLKAAPELRTDS